MHQDQYLRWLQHLPGLETNSITPEEKIVTKGVYPHGNRPICWLWREQGRTHGEIAVDDAIKHSCNYFFYEVATRTGIEELEKYTEMLGLGKKTNIELPGEIEGTIAGKKLYDKEDKTWYYGNTLSAAIGQGENNFTPIQVSKYISLIANGGQQIEPTLIKSIVKEKAEINKKEIKKDINKKIGIKEEKIKELNFKKENLEIIKSGMKGVTSETGGTAYYTFKDSGIEIAGKTGSAEAGENTNAWFVGFAPFDNPEIAIVVMVENGGHGSYTAEVARDVLKIYFEK